VLRYHAAISRKKQLNDGIESDCLPPNIGQYAEIDEEKGDAKTTTMAELFGEISSKESSTPLLWISQYTVSNSTPAETISQRTGYYK